MAGKRSRPVIGKLAGSLMFGNRTAAAAAVTSPRSPLEYTNAIQVRSPTKGSNKYDAAGGGVGLAIVAALEKSGGAASAVCGTCLNRSDPIPVNANCGRVVRGGLDMETYTCVTRRRGGPNQSITRLYCVDGGIGYDRRRECAEPRPPRFAEDRLFPSSDFLSACNWCRKKLHGRDIYMYRGEKAFCSNECRCRQITIDERREQCGTEVSRYADVSSSPCGATGQIFSTGIVAV